MSKRRKPGEKTLRRSIATKEGTTPPRIVTIPEGKEYEYSYIKKDDKWKLNPGGTANPCIKQCGDTECREWSKLETDVYGEEEKKKYIYNISECELEDWPGASVTLVTTITGNNVVDYLGLGTFVPLD